MIDLLCFAYKIITSVVGSIVIADALLRAITGDRT